MNRSENNSVATRCAAVRQSLPLYWYGELTAEAEASIDGHLSGCADCTQVWEQWKRTFAALDQDVLEPQPGMLESCRQELRDSLSFSAREPVRSPFRQWWQHVSAGFVLRPLPAIAGALAMLAIGFFAARTNPPSNGLRQSEPTGQELVRYVSPGPNGSVRLVVEETRQREVEGRMDDESIRGLLVRAAQHSTDPGLRVDTVSLLNRDSDVIDVRNALLSVLERDPNAGVRLKAVEGLKAYAHDDDVRNALSTALLRDEDPGIRMQIIDSLMDARRPDTVGVFQESILHEQNDYNRQRMLRALQEMNASAGTF